jgi:hypothetical protein
MSCFLIEKDKKMDKIGCDHGKCEGARCTKGVDVSSEMAIKVFVPSAKVDELMLRSACCCFYCGCNKDACSDLIACCNYKAETTCCCQTSAMQYGCTSGDDLRACSAILFAGKDCACESQEPGTPCLCSTAVMKESCLCLFTGGFRMTTECCPKDLKCYGGREQCCCMYSKAAFPCNDEVPCECGLCGVFCKQNKEAIVSWESKNPELMLGYITPEEEVQMGVVVGEEKPAGGPVAVEVCDDMARD